MLFCANSGTLSCLAGVAELVRFGAAFDVGFSLELRFNCKHELFLAELLLAASLATVNRSKTVDLILAVLLLTLPAMFVANIELELVELGNGLLVGSYLFELTEFDFLSNGLADALGVEFNIDVSVFLDFCSRLLAELFSSFTIDSGLARLLLLAVFTFVLESLLITKLSFSTGEDLLA